MDHEDANDLETLLSRALSAQLVPVASALDATARRLDAINTKLATIETLASDTAASVMQLKAQADLTASEVTSSAARLERIETRLAPLELVSGFIAANTVAANVTRLAELEARILVLEQQRRSS